jgi:hypothetical protein
MCPVVAAAPALRVPALRGFTSAALVVRPALRIHEAKTSRCGLPRVVGALFGGRGPSTSCQPSKCARWSPLRPWCGFELCGGFTSAAVKRSQVALEDPAVPARLGTGAGRVHRTFAVIAALSRVCTDQIRRTTTLEKDTTTGFGFVNTQRRSKDQGGAGKPTESRHPQRGCGGDHRAHSESCQLIEGPRPPNEAPTTLGKPKRLVLAS